MAESETGTEIEATAEPDAENSLPAKQVKERLDAGEIQLIDVRTEEEWAVGHIPGARHIELDRLPAEAEGIEPERPVVFQCRGGNRSAMAAEAFRTAGYEAYNMEGGLLAWVEEGLALEPEDGEVAESGRLPPP